MNTDTDILVIGAGPAGLAFCCSLADSDLNITVVEKTDEKSLQDPQPDGREIALTHRSKQILSELSVWQHIPEQSRHLLREAKVINGKSPYCLHFPTPPTAMGKPTDTLGYLISNCHIRRQLYQQAKQNSNLQIITDTTVEQTTAGEKHNTATLSNGQSITAKLVIAADSRFSQTRRQMGIAAEINDLGHTVIVFRMHHSNSNQLTATEWFHYGRTTAILPLGEHLSSIVVSCDSQTAERLWQMDAEQTQADITQQLEGKLGEMELVGSKHRYPLVAVHAKQFYAKRFALIGDAAVGMLPMTAHGFNLGLQSQDSLSRLIKQAQQNQTPYNSPELLQKYSRQHMLHTRPLYHGTNAIVKLFTTENPPAKILRQTALYAGNVFTPFKKLISKQLTGG